MEKQNPAKIRHQSEQDRLQDGSVEHPVVVSDMSREELGERILARNPEAKEVWNRQAVLDVRYLDKAGRFCRGQIIVDRELAQDVGDLFDFLLDQRIVVEKVVPIQDERYDGQDEASMLDNNSSAMNYRYIAATKRLSLHAFGFAIDINPRDNPVQKYGQTIVPLGAVRDEGSPDTFTSDHAVVKWLEERGWEWGGHWTEPYSDYHHFQKPLATEEYVAELQRQMESGHISAGDYEARLAKAKHNSSIGSPKIESKE